MSNLPAPARLNSHGEMEFEMEGVAYVLRPSREAIENIEKQTGQSILELANNAQSGRVGLNDLAIIVTETVKAWGREAAADADPNQLAARQFSVSAVKDHVYAAGLAQVNARLAVLLTGAVSGGYDPFGRARGAWAEQLKQAGAAANKKQTPPAV